MQVIQSNNLYLKSPSNEAKFSNNDNDNNNNNNNNNNLLTCYSAF